MMRERGPLSAPGRRLKILVSAYACAPGRGSDPGVGWNQVREMARHSDVWVITRANNRDAIEKAGGIPGARWIYVDLPGWLSFWKKGQRGVHLYYYLWQIAIYPTARSLSRRIRFDLVHHVTFVSYWIPSLLSLLPLPFIWGPVGGADSTPRAFLKDYSVRGRMYELLRRAAILAGELDPLVRLTARRTRIALAMTPLTSRRLARLGCREVLPLGESALSEEEIRLLSSLPRRITADGTLPDGFRFASVGRLLHLKGFHLGLRAFALARERLPGCSYWIIGGGPERGRLEALTESLGVGDCVRFLGHLPRREVLERLAECDALIHPSLHDSGGWVCLESMGAGRPVICLAHGGPALQVSDETGVLVPAADVGRTVQGIARAMALLAKDARLCARMGDAAQRRVSEIFSWSAKGRRMREIFEKALSAAPGGDARAAER